MAGREDTKNMMMAQQEIEDRIQPRSHAVTNKIEVNPWTTIQPDEVTIRKAEDDPDRPTCAELIRLVTSSYKQRG